MDRRERFLVALGHEEPDRVPLFFSVAMPRFTERWMARYEDAVEPEDMALFGGADLTMAKMMGFDAAWASLPTRFERVADPESFRGRVPELKPRQHITVDGRIEERAMLDGRPHTWYVGPGLADLDLWLEWHDEVRAAPLPGGQAAEFGRQYRGVVAGPKGGLLPVPTMAGILEIAIESLGFAEFAHACRKRRSDLGSALDRLLEVRLAHVRTMISVGVDAVILADDCAYKDNVYISPDLHRELIVPRYARIARELHEAGIKMLFHSDGFTEPFFPGIIEAGIDGVVTIETAAGMDLASLKSRFGNQLSLINPVDCSRLLSFGKPAEIEANIKLLVEQGAKGGGFVLGPCTAFLDSIPLENAEAMVHAAEVNGTYSNRC